MRVSIQKHAHVRIFEDMNVQMPENSDKFSSRLAWFRFVFRD